MSTMYYTFDGKQEIGQTSSLGAGNGYLFTWCIYPADYARYVRFAVFIKDENGRLWPIDRFEDMVLHARAQDFREGIV